MAILATQTAQSAQFVDAAPLPAPTTRLSGHVVTSATTAVEIVSDTPDPSEVFQYYDVSVHVSVVPPAAGTPTGIVSVVASDDPFPNPVTLDEAGNATCTIFARSAGDIELVAYYEGSSDYEPSQSTPEMHTVQRAATTTILMDENFFNSVVTEPVQFSVFVDTGGASGQPAGTVVIGDAGESCTATLAGNIASCTIAFAHAGDRAISATYSGDANFDPSTSDPLTHWVWQAQTGVSIVAHDPDPSTPMQPVTVTAEVSVQAPGAGVPPGPILVTGSFGEQCTIVQSGESCQLALVFRGLREITAQFVGDDDFGASTDTVQHRVNELPHVFGETYASNEDETLSVALEQGLLINDLDEDGDHLTVVNTGPQTATGIGGTVTLNADGSFSYAPPPNAFGDAAFEYVVSDGYETVSASTTLTVNPVNDPPSFTLAASPKWPANTSGAQFTVAFATPTDFGPGESDYVLAWHVRTIDDPNGVLSGKATIGGDDNLYYTLTGHGGVATLGVTLQDDGGTANGGNDTSPEQMFTITVGSGADLSVAIDDGTDFAIGGDPLLYMITVRNLGPDRVDGARVYEMMLSNLVDATWVCTPSAGASCTANGTGSIEDYVNLPSGGTLVYELTATVLAIPEQPAYNYISVSPPAGVTDFNAANDAATDVDITGVFADGFDVIGDAAEDAATATRK